MSDGKFDPADVVPEPCPNGCGRPGDGFGDLCRVCGDNQDDPDNLEHVGPELQPDWS